MTKRIDGVASSAVTPYDFTIEWRTQESTRCRVTEIDYQRNGVSGEGFFVCRFMCSSHPERPLIGVVFGYSPGEPGAVEWTNPATAVIDPTDLTSHWRGDHFDQGLRDAIKARYEEIWAVIATERIDG